jgi:hypothetical protein
VCEFSHPTQRALRLDAQGRDLDPAGMPTNSPQVSPLALAAGLGGFVAAVLAAAVVGIVLAVSLITGPAAGHHADPGDGPFGVAEDIRTSFGYVAVEHAETVKGLTAKDLAGAVHGIGDFVGAERALVKASVTLRNGPQDTLPYSLRQFTLVATRDGKERRFPVFNASVRDGLLQPDAAVDASLGFVVPRNGAELALEFADAGRKQPIVIDLETGAGRATAADNRATQHGH